MHETESNATTRWGINFLALFGLVVALRYGRVMMIPVVISLMLTCVLWPSVQFLQRQWRWPRVLAGVTVTAGLVAATALVLAWAIVAVSSVWATLPPSESWLTPYHTAAEEKGPAYEGSLLGLYVAEGTIPLGMGHPAPYWVPLTTSLPSIQPHLWPRPGFAELPLRSPYQRVHDRVERELSKSLADDLFPPDPKQSFLYRNLKPLIDEQSRFVPSYVSDAIWQILFILFLVMFLLIEGVMFMRRTGEIFGPSTGPYSKAAIKALEDMATQVRAYLVWRTIINMGMVLVLGLIYKYVLGLTFPWVWAILAGVLTYVPYIGPMLAFVPTSVDALFSPGGGVWALIGVTILYSLILFAEGYIVFPLVIGRNMEMNATTVMLACLFWWLVWGEIGLFLALPMMGAIRAICQNVPGWEPWANLMGMETHGEPGSARRGRIRRFVATLLAGPLLPLARWLNVERWARANAVPVPQPRKAENVAVDGNGQPLKGSATSEKSEELTR